MNALAFATAGNPKGVNGVALAVLIGLFLLVTVMGFMASRWRRGTGMESLDEWGLGGRSFGTWVTWFLLGGDLYTAYTLIAVPAAMFALGSVNGFFAVPYTIVLYPIIFIFMSRLWSVSHRQGSSRPRTSWAAATARAGCPWSSPLPASWPRCRTSPFSS
jgi:SSS family solute:Na+ symporter